MLVLLIIFMVTAPMMQQGLTVNLPQARRASPVTSQPIYVTIPANFGDTRIVPIGDDDVRVDILHERVRQAILPREDKSLFLRMDATRDGAEHDGRDGSAEAGGRRQDRHHDASRRSGAAYAQRAVSRADERSGERHPDRACPRWRTA